MTELYLSEERLSELDGDILFMSVYDEDSEKILADWQRKPLWNQLQVVQNKQVYLVNAIKIDMLTKTNGIFLTKADFAELEEEAQQQGELLYREIELGTDAYFPSALGKLCDRFIYLINNLSNLKQTIKAYSKRMGIEAMFKDCKSGGYNLEQCQAKDERLLILSSF